MSETGVFEDKVVVMAMLPRAGEDRVQTSMCVDPWLVPFAREVLGVVSTDLREIPMPANR